MFSKKTFNLGATLAFRLAFSLSILVGVCLLIAFVAVYAVMTSNAHYRIDARLRHEASEVKSLFSLRGDGAIQEVLTHLAHAEGTDQVCYRLIDRHSAVLAESDVTSWKGLTIDGAACATVTGERPVFESVSGDSIHGEARVLYAVFGDDMILQVAIRTAHELQPMRDLRRLFFTAGVLGVCFSIIVGWVTSRRALAPLRSMTATALTIAEGDFDARMKLARRDAELDQLANAFNAMLDRIQVFVRELRHMNDSLAHDLRSVLARIRLAAERLLATRPITPDQESLAVSIVEESAELLGMLNTIMELSEMNTGVVERQFSPVDLSELVAELFEFFEVTAEEKQISMNITTSDSAVVSGDRNRLRRALANVLDNAIKYTGPGGRVWVEIRPSDGAVDVSIADTGIGIPESALPYIFDRFYRADQSRSMEGHGLGLSLAAAIVHLHGGKIHIQSKPGQGSVFTVTLPRAPTKVT